MTITLAIGKYGGFYAQFNSQFWRICLGWIAITLYFSDLEDFITKLIKEKNKVENCEGCGEIILENETKSGNRHGTCI